MDQFSKEELKDLLTPCGGHCVSLYLPTHRAPVEGRQDLIRFKNMLRETEERLISGGVRGAEAKEFLLPLHRLLDDLAFWQYRGDGLAVFYSKEKLRTYRLPVHFEELVVVANRFYLKPLIPLLAEESGFYVLALSQNEIRLLEGNRYCAWEMELEHVPTSLAEAIQYDEPQKQLQFRSQTPPGLGGKQRALFFAHGVGLEDNKDDIRRYFRQIDKGLQEVLRQDHTPLILAGVEYLFPLYREVNTYPNLMKEGIPGSPEMLSPEELHQRAWKKMIEPLFLRSHEEVIAQYKQLAGTGRTSRDLREIVPAAARGQVEKLVVATGVQAWGSYLLDRGAVEMLTKPAADSEDLLDLAAMQTFVNGGMVYTVDPKAVPENAPAVALFRY